MFVYFITVHLVVVVVFFHKPHQMQFAISISFFHPRWAAFVGKSCAFFPTFIHSFIYFAFFWSVSLHYFIMSLSSLLASVGNIHTNTIRSQHKMKSKLTKRNPYDTSGIVTLFHSKYRKIRSKNQSHVYNTTMRNVCVCVW